MHDEEVVKISGTLQFSCYAGYADSFEFRGDYDAVRDPSAAPATVVAMDALYGAKFRQFEEGLVVGDLLYHIRGDRRAAALPALVELLQEMTAGDRRQCRRRRFSS